MSITSSGGEVTGALEGQLKFEQSKNRITLINEDRDMRLILGEMPDGTVGFIISKEGVDSLDLFEVS